MNKIILLFIFFSVSAGATEQIKEVLIDGDDEYYLFSYPLETLFKPDEIPGLIGAQGMCSALWRGYRGKWEIKEKVLYLVNLEIDACSDPKQVSPVEVFGQENYPIRAQWLTGEINAPLSKREYLYETKEDGERKYTGWQFDAIVYKFSNGILTSKSKEKVVFKYEEALTNQASGTP